MRIALLVDPEIPVPPKLYGGIERVVHFLANGLTARGHDVTLFAHPDSVVDCALVPWHARTSGSKLATAIHAAQFARFVAAARDRSLVIHSFARLAYLTPLLPWRLPAIQSYQRRVTPRSVVLGNRLSRGSLHFTACSASCAATSKVERNWHVIYNGVDLANYAFRPEVPLDAPLMFLGRIERIKGAHHALEIARRSGRRLIVAGNLPERGPDVDYARQIVAQCDGDRFVYVGPVDDRQKDGLLGSAACLLMPIEWEEPFGIVMAEALACGTPVIGLHRGSVPEVVEHGASGFVCSDVPEMVAAVARLPELSRAASRRAAEARFSSQVIVAQYEALYAEVAGTTTRAS